MLHRICHLVLFCTHTKHIDGMFYVIIYLKSRWWWRQLPPLLPPSNANHLFWHSIFHSLPACLSPSLSMSFKGKGRKNFLTFQQSLCRLINLMLYTEIQTHLLAFTHTPRVSFGRMSSSPRLLLPHSIIDHLNERFSRTIKQQSINISQTIDSLSLYGFLACTQRRNSETKISHLTAKFLLNST